MPSNNKEKIYPHARLSVDGAGDLLDITNVKIDAKNNGKLVSTLRGKGGTSARMEYTITFDCPVSQAGRPHPWSEWAKLGANSIHTLRFKIPGETIPVTGFFDGFSTDGPHDDAIKDSLSFMGWDAA